MATARDYVRKALLLVGVLEAAESATAEQGRDGLDTLNRMLASWRNRGVELEQPRLGLSDEVTVPADTERAIEFNLACELAPYYQVPIDQKIFQIAETTFRDLQGVQLADMERDLPDKLAHLGRHNRRNIDDGLRDEVTSALTGSTP